MPTIPTVLLYFDLIWPRDEIISCTVWMINQLADLLPGYVHSLIMSHLFARHPMWGRTSVCPISELLVSQYLLYIASFSFPDENKDSNRWALKNLMATNYWHDGEVFLRSAQVASGNPTSLILKVKRKTRTNRTQIWEDPWITFEHFVGLSLLEEQTQQLDWAS